MDRQCSSCGGFCKKSGCERENVTISPKREWQGLTDEEMHECWDSPLTPLGMKHARMIEAKLKEKKT